MEVITLPVKVQNGVGLVELSIRLLELQNNLSLSIYPTSRTKLKTEMLAV